MRYAGICFDLDGTLVDTASEIAEVANRTLAEFGLPRLDEALITTFLGQGARHTMLRLLAQVLQATQAAAGICRQRFQA